MTRILSDVLVLGLQWEMLIGLEKEATEVRNLATQRGADHVVVLDNGQGARVVGLAALTDASRPEVDTLQPQRLALAGLVGGLSATRDGVFIHPDPASAEQVLFMTRRDGQPELDLSLPIAQALERLRAFQIEVKGARLIGVTPIPPQDEASERGVADTSEPVPADSQPDDWPAVDVPLTLEMCLQAVKEGTMTEYLLSPLRRPPKWAPIRRQIMGGAVALGMVASGYYGWTLVDQTPPPLVVADPVEAFQHQQRQKLSGEPLKSGAEHARAVQRAIASLPSSAGGWRADAVACDPHTCVATWVRSEGGTFDSLLAHRPAARPHEIDTAEELLALPTEVVGQIQVEPSVLDDFLKAAGSRLHELRDYGKEVLLEMPQPLIPVPLAVAQRPDVRPVSKGQWALQGHLAFMDSLPGLLARTRNMALVELEVAIDQDAPSYTAKGTYYVH